MSNTDEGQTTTVPVPVPKRMTNWVILTISSAVLLGALADELPRDERDARNKCSIAFSGITLTLGIIFTLKYIFFPTIQNTATTIIETIFITISFFLSLIGLAFNMKINFISENSNGNLVMGMNANIYYFSWVAFFTTLFMISSYMKQALKQTSRYMGVDEETMSSRFTKWFALMMFNIVLFADASYIYQSADCDNTKKYCRRTILTISLGVISSSFALVIQIFLIFKLYKQMMKMLEALFSGIIGIMYVICVGLITGSDSPGKYIGNVYYFTWLSYVVAMVLASECVSQYVVELIANRRAAAAQRGNEMLTEALVEEGGKEKD